MKTTVNWVLTFMFILFVSFSSIFAWKWYVDNKWLNNFEIFGPKMFWEKQQQFTKHLFIISTIFALVIAIAGITTRSIRKR